MKTLRTYSLNNFPVYHTAVLPILIMFYVVPSSYLSYDGSLYLWLPFLQYLFSHSLPLATATNLISFSLNLVGIFCFSWILLNWEHAVWICLSVRLTSLSMMPSRFTHSVTNGRVSSLFMAKLHTQHISLLFYPFTHHLSLKSCCKEFCYKQGCRYLFELVFLSFWI